MARDLGGKTIGGYKLGEVLGRGASSTVYAAEHESTGRSAAVKVFSVDLGKDKTTIPRVIAEMQKATAATHPNLPTVLDIGTCEAKGKRLVYIATERLTGESLRARILRQKEKALPLPVALQIASDVGAALQAISRAGGSHRHVNSGAVFLASGDKTPSGDVEERAYLLDLGTACVPSDSDGKPEKSDGKGDKSGKVEAKPGKGGGNGKARGESDDLRSLALLVQEMLGGAPESLPPLARAQRSRRVPARIDAVLRVALGDAAGQNERFENVAALLAALLGVSDAQPALGAWSEDGRALQPPRRAGFGLGWAAVLAIIGGSAIGYWRYSQESTGPSTPATADLAAPATSPDPSQDLARSALDPGTPTGPNGAAGTPDGAADLAVRSWPKRTGTIIPPLRDADQANPTSPAATAGGGAKAPTTTAAPAGSASAGTQPPAAPRAPAANAAAPAAQTQQPQARPATPASPPRPDGQKEVK